MNKTESVYIRRKARNGFILLCLLCVGITIFFFRSNEANSANNKEKISKDDTTQVSFLLNECNRIFDKHSKFQTHVDSALSLAQEALKICQSRKYELGIGKCYLTMAKAYRQSDKPLKARDYSKKALSIFTKYNSNQDIANAYLELGASFTNPAEDLEEKIKWYQEGIKYLEKAKDTLKQAEMMQFVAELYGTNSEFSEALELANKTLAVYKSIKYERLHGLYDLMGILNSRLNNSSDALRYGLLAAKTGEQVKDSGIIMATIYNRLAKSYAAINYHNQAIDNYKKGLATAIRLADTPTIRILLLNTINELVTVKHYDESLQYLKNIKTYPNPDSVTQMQTDILYMRIYLAQKNMKEADIFYQRLLKWYQTSVAYYNFKLDILSLCSDYAKEKHSYSEAYHFLSTYYTVADADLQRYNYKMNYESRMYQLDSITGNFSGAFKHFQVYKLVDDSVFNVIKTKQYDQLRLAYETDKKNRDIKSLQERNLYQNNVISRAELVRNITIGGAIMLFLLLLISFKAYRQKQQSNVQLQAQQTQIHQQNESLRKLLSEKEWLVKEIHHRVKNNLQIVISLLNTQSAYLDNEDALLAIQNSQHRMYAMSLIHQRLYQSSNLSSIDMNWYIQEMVKYMRECFDTRNIKFILNVARVSLDVVQAVPLGLILNEAITNAIKYAFKEYYSGQINIDLKVKNRTHCVLNISDDGVGLSDDIDLDTSDSLGMSLMRGLSEQIGGSLTIKSEKGNGLCLSLQFEIQSESNEISSEEISVATEIQA